MRVNHESMQDSGGNPVLHKPEQRRLNPIVDSEGKSFGQKSVIAEMEQANSSIKMESRKYSQSFRPPLVKRKSIDKILLSFVKNLNPHSVNFLILCLASSKPVNWVLPSPIRFSLADRKSPCQKGEGKDSGLRQRSSPNRSISAS